MGAQSDVSEADESEADKSESDESEAARDEADQLSQLEAQRDELLAERDRLRSILDASQSVTSEAAAEGDDHSLHASAAAMNGNEPASASAGASAPSVAPTSMGQLSTALNGALERALTGDSPHPLQLEELVAKSRSDIENAVRVALQDPALLEVLSSPSLMDSLLLDMASEGNRNLVVGAIQRGANVDARNAAGESSPRGQGTHRLRLSLSLSLTLTLTQASRRSSWRSRHALSRSRP